MAIGDTVQAGLGRMDFSAFQTAGAAQARANEAFGNALGQAATAYFAGKEKKERAKEIEEELIRQGASPDSAKAISKNPFLQKEHARREEANQRMKIAQMQARTSIANSKRGAMSRNAELEFQREKFEAGQDLLDEQKALNESLAKFSMQPVLTPTPEFSALQQEYRPEQIPGTPEFIAMEESEPMGARPSIIAKTITEQPDFQRFVKQDSPAVAQLPDSFKPQGRRIQEAVESGELSNQAGMIAINNLAQQIPTSIELTEGEKALDKKFADEMTEFNLPDINKGLDQLTEASDALSKSDTLTGPIVSLMPKFISDRLNPKAAEVREAVEEVVQRNLRLVLGSQFTEKEGERLISRAYNPALDESENKKRVERLIKSIRDAAQEKINMRTYFSRNGTLKGYDYIPVTLESIERNAFSQDGMTSNLKPADIQSEIERKKQMLRARQMNAQYFDNPNVPNIGNINSGN